ncbi:MAG TPA: dynamin family protein [Neobacillus sp.]
MVQIANFKETSQALKNKIIALYEYLIQHEDFKNAEKVKQLAKKLDNREFMIAFCGHFSAGKSTMINKLIGENLLPSSPIPTSANLVKVRTGEEYAKVFFKNEKPRLYLAPYDYETVKNYCKDGDQIKEIEISHGESNLPKNTIIMDTPGIDSANDAHRVATESAIHLADLVFYVMDYNHVQAEINFLFTKELTKAGKEVYLVINQIDKHNDDELSFQDFQKSVNDSFASWGVKPLRIFYTTLKESDHRFNEFHLLQQFISQKLETNDHLLGPSIFYSLKKIGQDHLYHSQKLAEELLQPKITLLNGLSNNEKKELTEAYKCIRENIETMTSKEIEFERDFDRKTAQIMENAYLMPFQTRKLAETYLETCQAEFKVGFLFTKQKTTDEKNARLDSFYQEIREKTKLQIEWHLREYLLCAVKEQGLDQGELQLKAQNFSIHIPVALIVNSVNPGARLSGQYVLHYTETVTNEIKKIARSLVNDFKNSFLEALTVQNTFIKEQNENKLKRIEQYVTALEELKKHKNYQSLKEKQLNEIMTQNAYARDSNELFNQEEEEYEVVKFTGVNSPIKNGHALAKIPVQKVLPHFQNKEGKSEKKHLEHMVERLQKSSELINNLPGFQKIAQDLQEKASRLANKGFTVALFGAFSAGKSSFANALMGEKVLPVSPNPTTAAINKIKPITTAFPHGTVRVKFKEKPVMLEDVNRSLKTFDFQANDFDEAYRKVAEIIQQKGQEGVLEKSHFTFLKAFTKGYDPFVKLLGTVLETDLTEFNEFVANEEKSCFIEWLELYYDCEMTRKGITIVDTPGADSINARHTGVAFDYIKNSDAILFVTYYNHAFSKADREFLIQLGRVKDSFQLDKMFFIINAIDLAENNEEKETVANYVREQLGTYGIRNPHLFTLSSLLALKEKIIPTAPTHSGMIEFKRSFNHFISNDLTEMAITSAKYELGRVQGLLEKLIQSSMEDKDAKEQKRINIENQKSMIKEVVHKQTKEHLQNHLLQESEELVYYMKQRVFLRFSDFFKEAFNPSTLRDDGRNLKKALLSALDEFLESFGFDFAQEMRATTIRLDRFAEKLLVEYHSTLIRNLHEINGDLSFPVFEMKQETEIMFESAFKDLDKQIFSKAMSYFKNPKSFFEKNEKKWVNDELEKVLNGQADLYLTAESTRLNHHYSTLLTTECHRLLREISEQTENFYLSLLATLDGGLPTEYLIEIRDKLGFYFEMD